MAHASSQRPQTYVGLDNDLDGGLTQLGRCVMDARVFELIPEDETCAGWRLDQMLGLLDRVNAKWDEYGTLPSRLPPELRERHERIYREAMDRGRASGWDPDFFEEDQRID